MQRKQPTIILVGPLAAGKSSIGRYLARLLHMEFYDIDREIEERAGVDIPFIVEKEGEEGFRAREKKILRELVELKDIVLATGGGTIAQQENYDLLRHKGYVIYLDVSINQQMERTRKCRRRPMLDVDDKEQVLQGLREERIPLYSSLAHMVYCSDMRTPRAVASEIIELLNEDDEYVVMCRG
jgi:shikimate kinase